MVPRTSTEEIPMTATARPSTAQVAQELVALCRAGRNLDAVNKLYSPKIVSTEPVGSPEMPAEMSGIDAIRGKHEWWEANNEVHSIEANGPFLGQDQFAVQFIWDATFKPTGRRQRMTEMALYTVKDGKIVREQFFYNVPGE
jgi:ketosteroid isomerase-like protein